MPCSEVLPRIVCVLPLLVWPYANTVPLIPVTTFLMISSVVTAYTRQVLQLLSKTWSKE